MIYSGPELNQCTANHSPLSPVSILKRVERVHPELPAQIHGTLRRNWGEVAERCKRLASALINHGEANVLLVDTEYFAMAHEAVALSGRDLLVIDIEDSQGPGGDRIGSLSESVWR